MAGVDERLRELRALLLARDLDLYLVPSSDAHQNEYVPEHWQRRAWISGFTGSAGEVVVGRERAWLFTDSRYWLQAEAQLDAGLFELMRVGAPGVPDVAAFVRSRDRAVLGVDPELVTAARARELEEAANAAGGALRLVAENLVDAVRGDPGRPAPRPAELWPLSCAGESVAGKLSRVRDELRVRGAEQLVVTKLDAIAWLLNLRGRDVAYNPLLISYALVGLERATLFTEPSVLGEELLGQLAGAGVDVEPYARFFEKLAALDGRVAVDPDAASAAVVDRLPAERVQLVHGPDPIAALKACKNPVEQTGMRESHVRDGVALVRFLHWLHERVGVEPIDEWSAAEKLDALRQQGGAFKDLSFPTISGFGPNGAIVHYRVARETALPVDDSAPYLVDSGAHYQDGTTDVTRTVHLGVPSAEQRELYTRVLKGHLAVRGTRFPAGTSGAALDALARRALWEVGLDYGHNTGHGVGCYLNVHEGPPGIGPRYTTPLEAGMVVSNEPGVYLAGRFGIRIENLLLVVPLDPRGPDARPFLGFDDLTLVPYARELIDAELLSPGERAAVDAYHARCHETLSGRLEPDVAAWLARATAALG